MNTLLILFDGTCGFCQSSVQFVLQRDRCSQFFFAPLQGPTAAALFLRHGIMSTPESVVLVLDHGQPQERLYLKSRAALQIGVLLPQPWRFLAHLGKLLPTALLDRVYDFVPRRRHGLKSSCLIPTQTQQQRFLP